VLLGVLISFGIAAAFPLPTRVTPALVIAGLAVALITGVAAGFFPAMRAANRRRSMRCGRSDGCWVARLLGS